MKLLLKYWLNEVKDKKQLKKKDQRRFFFLNKKDLTLSSWNHLNPNQALIKTFHRFKQFYEH